MNFDKWIDVFTLKTSIENVPEFDGLEEALNTIYKKIIIKTILQV